jgi:fucose permease
MLRYGDQGLSKRGVQSQTNNIGGFKTTFIVGLLIYGTGTIMFWPSAVLGAYGGFACSNFVVGFGLAVLETAANP